MMTMRDQLSNVTVSVLSQRCKHEAQGAGRGAAGAGTGQRQRCIDGVVYSAEASGDMIGKLNTVIECHASHKKT
jgi:hypothetical protein